MAKFIWPLQCIYTLLTLCVSAKIAKGSPRMGGHVWPPQRGHLQTHWWPSAWYTDWFDSFIWRGNFCIRWDDVYILEWAFLADTLASMRKGLNAKEGRDQTPSESKVPGIFQGKSQEEIRELNQWTWKAMGQSICCKIYGCHFWRNCQFLSESI